MRFIDHISLAGQFYRLWRSQWWSQHQILRYQETHLVKMMRYAVTRIPFYQALRISPDGLNAVEDIKKFPVLTKKDIQENGDRLLCPGFKSENLYVSKTSGSSCVPTSTYFDRNAWLFSKYALKMRRVFALGNPFLKRILIITPQGSEHIQREAEERLKGVRHLVMQRHLSLFDDIEKHIPVILEYRPHIIYGFPSYLVELASYFKTRNMNSPTIPIVYTSSELLTPLARNLIETSFSAKLYDIYGSTEFKEVAWECYSGTYHVNFENVYLENIHGNDSGAEECPELFITSLMNFAMPLLRFDIGDKAKVEWINNCPCGRSSPVIRNIRGRETDWVLLPSGRKLSPYLLTTAIEEHPSIRKFQITQKSPSQLSIDLVGKDGEILNAIFPPLERELHGIIKENIHITFRQVENIDRSRSGKYQILKRE